MNRRPLPMPAPDPFLAALASNALAADRVIRALWFWRGVSLALAVALAVSVAS